MTFSKYDQMFHVFVFVKFSYTAFESRNENMQEMKL